jgi:dienelactone hydrolase
VGTKFLALLALLQQASLPVQHVRIPEPGGVVLDAALVHPTGPLRAPAVVALHGCGGPVPSRDAQWARTLAGQGHIVLLPDSFGSRGLGSQCRVKQRLVKPSGARRQDAIAAARWLADQPGTPAGGIVLLGWSNGGGTVLFTADEAPDLPPGLFSRFVAFYPGCKTEMGSKSWKPAAPLMILVGANDDWTPAASCEALARKFPDEITFVAYPGAWHDFDRPDRPVRVLHGLATPPSGTGAAHAGTNEAARLDALRRVPAFIAAAVNQ